MGKREDLELAAKAAKLQISWMHPVDEDLFPLKEDLEVPRTRRYPYFIDAEGFRVEWNPEHSNKDSFGLLVALSSHIAIGDISHPLSASSVSLPCGFCAIEQHNGDPESATRLAILRAAIETGRRLRAAA